MLDWMNFHYDEGDGAGSDGGTDGGADALAIFNERDMKVLTSNGVDVKKLATDPAEGLKAAGILMRLGAETGKKLVDTEKALKTLRKDSVSKSQIPQEVIREDGTVDNAALTAIQQRAKASEAQAQLIELLHEQGKIGEDVYNLIAAGDPEFVAKAMQMGLIGGSGGQVNPEQNETIKQMQAQIEEMSKLLTGGAVLGDLGQGGSEPPVKQSDMADFGAGAIGAKKSVFKDLQDQHRKDTDARLEQAKTTRAKH